MKVVLVFVFLLSPIKVSNGYYQVTKINFEGLEGTCYGTLLSKSAGSGTWSSQTELDLNAPDDVLEAFDAYQDKDGYFYLNYIQDVSGGLMYWHLYPPEDFKVLLYFPDTDTFISTDTNLHRYALTSAYNAKIENGVLYLTEDYDYGRMILNTIVRILLFTLITFVIALIFSRPFKNEWKHIIIPTFLFYLLIEVIISIYSFKNGFSIVEYFMLLWAPYIPFTIFQGYYYKKNTQSIAYPHLCSFYSNVGTYVVGMLIIEFFKGLFTIT